ncbi:MAG: alpha-D-glucose phosphate-specific phosphoglucomutase [Bdellovibrio sp. 28-41-41]|nr:MAG: alpha-D-glucose phosphate-specific phosphoglucomutase [Bdellovibrio sp. 28-41-41]
MNISPFAGQLPGRSDLIDVEALLLAYEKNKPDPYIEAQQVSFGTSGHRGCSFNNSFNENHILAITQAICLYRKLNDIKGPLFLGFDTHALSLPAFQSALEVLAANYVQVIVAQDQEFTPTPAISHAILCHNKNRKEGFADGIIITPSHNPPREGGFKYNPIHGGPAEKKVTDWIQIQANGILKDKLNSVRQVPFEIALIAETTTHQNFLRSYVEDLKNIIDMDVIRDSKIKIAVDPLGGAGVHYWEPIADIYKINLSVLNTQVDPQFAFMTRDWDGQIRMDPSSKFAMQSLIKKSQNFDISFACDTDHDRHGIVTKGKGLMPANDYLATMCFYLFQHRSLWKKDLKIGKTIVSTKIIERVAAHLDRKIFEMPVGFKWFVQELLKENLGFAGEESAGATFLRKDGTVWTTDKDAFVPALLSAEMTAKLGKDPSEIYDELTQSLGKPYYSRIEVPATKKQRDKLNHLTDKDVVLKEIARDKIESVRTIADGNSESIEGIQIESKNGWVAMRPSGTEDIYKIYAESFVGPEHLQMLLCEAQKIASDKIANPSETNDLIKKPEINQASSSMRT